MSILRIDTSARLENSNSRAITAHLVEQLIEKNLAPNGVVSRDLGRYPLPSISAEDLVDLHGSIAANRDSLHKHVEQSQVLIEELKAAETLVIGVPLYNFGVPVVLKQWVDYICRAGETFKYGENGPVGLSGVKRAFIVVASGGTPVGSATDFVTPYLQTIMSFIGVEETIVIDVAGSKRTPALVIEQAKAQIAAAIA